MAFFDKVKAAFDRGGIGLKLELPKQFSWGDPTVPATVTLTGHKSEPRTVKNLGFVFMDTTDPNDDESHATQSSGETVQLNHEHSEAINLAPGEKVTLTIDVPAYLDPATFDQALSDAGLSPAARKAMQFAQKLGVKPERIKHYTMVVSAHVDGVKHPKQTSRRIRNKAADGISFKVAGFDIR